MESKLTFKVRNGWWMDCGHKLRLSKSLDEVAFAGAKVNCYKCDRKISRHSSNKRRPYHLIYHI